MEHGTSGMLGFKDNRRERQPSFYSLGKKQRSSTMLRYQVQGHDYQG